MSVCLCVYSIFGDISIIWFEKRGYMNFASDSEVLYRFLSVFLSSETDLIDNVLLRFKQRFIDF